MKDEISLDEIYKTIKKHIGKIIVWGLAGLLFMGVYTFFFVTPSYQSTSKIVVNQTQNTSQVITNNDIQTNLNLINTYQSIIMEPIILEEVLNSTNIQLTPNELAEKISVQTQNNSLVFAVTVSDENPYVASDLANATANSFENNIGGILEVQNVTILSEAVPILEPVSPSIFFNLLLGFLVGLIFGLGITFLSEMTDRTVKDEKFIEELGWTNLGSIFEMTQDEIKDTRMKKNLGSQPRTNLRVSRRRV